VAIVNIFTDCIITASDERQAEVFRALIARRIEAGLYPREIDFAVCADPPGGRVGSGGGTLWALRNAARRMELEGTVPGLGGHRALVIHAGGESRRLPAYVPEGKLFAPLPSPSSSLIQPVIFDHMLALFLRYPWRDDELVVCSGDVVIDFETELLDLPDGPLCGFAAPDSFERGSRHGVFAFDPLTGAVSDYFQKASKETLEREARIDGRDACAVDLGIASFRGDALEALKELAERRLESKAGSSGGTYRFDLYLELMSACLGNLDLESYIARVGVSSCLSRAALEEMYELFHPCGLSGVLVKSPLFLHFGSAAEYPSACAELREKGHTAFYALPSEELVPEAGRSLVRFSCSDTELDLRGPGSYAENCSGLRASLEGGNMLVGVRSLALRDPLPRGICIDERRIDCGRDHESFRLVYHTGDTFKPVSSLDAARFCGIRMNEWLEERDLARKDICADDGPFDLYRAELFASSGDGDFLSGYWRRPGDPAEWARAFRASRRISIAWANENSDACARDRERSRMREAELEAALGRGGFFALSARDLAALVSDGLDAAVLVERYATTDDPLLKSYRGAALRKAGVAGIPAGERIEMNFAPNLGGEGLRISVKLDQIVWARSPARLDIAGGWTDTPPYTNRYGGAVVNLAVDLNGQSPIQVFVRRSPEPRIRIHSIDLGLTETITDTAGIRGFGDPGSPFALPKAALVLLGLGAGLADGAPLSPALEAAGGGLELTLLCAIPKGSGLGTSSILAGTILGALERFFGLSDPPETLFLQVLEMEQMLTTGGGWQDQIGGLAGGVKYIESRPGLKPRPMIHQLDPWAFEDPSSAGLMTLFYTGVTRLAKNILQDVVARVNGMERAYLFTHGRLANLARGARDAISLRDLDLLRRIVADSFRENKLIHASTTNREIDEMAAMTAPYCGGMKLLGAGGGGFALFLSPDRGSTEALRGILTREFEDDRARIVDFSLNKKGLQVTVS
jgi:galactokinase/mevalonate kinase-like predicted kinase